MTEISAGWVLPVDGQPIENGRVRFEDGAIVEVGPGRADRHFEDAAIVPGFVNAHSHLEYSLYAGFGDGTAFGPWLATHVARKGALEPAEMLALARRGRARLARLRDHDDRRLQLLGCRRDRSRGARPAGDRLPRGLRHRPARRGAPVHREAQRSRRDASSCGSASRRTRPTHARWRCTGGASRSGSRSGRTWPSRRTRTSGCSTATGPLEAIGHLLVEPTGERAAGTLASVLGPGLLCAHCVELDPSEVALLGERRRAGRPLPALERAARLRGRAARRAARRRRHRRARDRLARLGALVRRLRGDARRDLRRPGPSEGPGGAAGGRRSAPRDRRCGPRSADRRSGGYPDARQARRSDGGVARGKPLPSGRGSRRGSRLRRLSRESARDDRRRADPLQRSATNESRTGTVARGTQHRKRRPAQDARSAGT